MTILITGGAGFIGSRLHTSLGHDDIVVVDNLHDQVHGSEAMAPSDRSGLRFLRGDVTDAEMWDGLLADVVPTTIVHLAAETGTGQSLHQSARHTNVNVNGTAVMLDALSRKGVLPQAIVLTSSRAVYGEGQWQNSATQELFYGEPRVASRLDAREWLPVGPRGEIGEPLPHRASRVEPRPSNVYAATKLAQENILTAWCASMEVSLSILRLQNVYGAGQALRNPYTGVLTAFARQVLSGNQVEVYEGGGIVRDFVHVSDVAAAVTAAVHRPAAHERRRLVDIGSGHPDSLHSFASVLARQAEGSSIATSDRYRLGDVRSAWADNTEAEAELDYRPSVSFEDGSQELLVWAEKEIARGE
jgi:dTDP-L-rhamnose 4-epimerase